MSGIGKPNGFGKNGKADPNEDSIALKEQFQQVTDEIRKIINGRKDKSQLTAEEKRELALLYSKAASIAKKISDTVTSEKESEEYKEKYKLLMNKAESYGSARKNSIPTTTLEDVKGLDNVKALVESFLYMAQHQNVLEAYNMKGGLGMLLFGAPGTGKTMIAEAIANRMQWPLFVVTPSDIFKSYVGESEAAVKQLFKELEACPDGAILFVDECESIFSKRTSDTKDYKSAVTNELLQRINGFGVDGSKRILIGATNRPDQIDPAYLRYKRFSHLIHVTPPDEKAKRAIIESKLAKIPTDNVSVDDVLYMTIRSTTESTSIGDVEVTSAYYSSADICGALEEASRLAIEKLVAAKSETVIPVTREMFEEAFNKIPPSISANLLEAYDKFREDPSLLDKYYGSRR